MNKFTSIIFCLVFLVISNIHSQFGEPVLPGISYQALIIQPEESLPGYNNIDAPMVNQSVCLQFSIITGNGTLAYQEFQGTETNAFGMINTIIGRGIINIGLWNDIDWIDFPVYLKVEINLKGQCFNYSLLSYEELTAVPFALNAQNNQNPGPPGESAFDTWLAMGNTGTEIDFLVTLSGETGVTGMSAYETWLDLGNTGTEIDFLVTLSGETGVTGMSAYETWLDLGNTGTEIDFLVTLSGETGVTGMSAYETWLDLGNTGTEQQFIDSLLGADGVIGESAYETWLDLGNTGTEQQFIDSLQGEDGESTSTDLPDGDSSGDILNWVWNGTTWEYQIINGNSSSIQLLTSINSSNQISCEFSTIDTIKYGLSGTSTNVTVNGLPNGIVSRISNDTLYIEGTSSTDFSQQTRYLYTVQSLNGDDQTSGSFTFNPSATVTLTSGNLTQNSCLGQDISPMVFTLSGAVPNANVTGLPTGVIASISGNSLTISGTPSSTITNGSTYSFTIQSLAETCDPVTVQGSISFSDCSSCFPNSSAGNDATVCYGDIFTPDSNASNYSSLNWTTSGGGTFNNPSLPSPDYLPSSADLSSGSVVLTLTAQNTSCITPQTIRSSITIAVVDCNSISATIVNQDKCIVFGNDLTFGASIVTTNIGSILAGGICYSTSGVPTVLDTKVEISNNSLGDWAASPPSFEATLINVPINSALYVRAYVETINGDFIYGELIDVISENPNLNHIFNFSEVSGLFNINDYPVTTTSEITFKKIEKLTGINWDSSNIISRNIERVNFPLLDTINGYPGGILIRNEYSIKTIFAPLLKKVFRDINIDNTSLETILLPEVQEVNLLDLDRNQSLDSINFNKLSKTTYTNNSTQYPRYFGINILNNASINTLKFPSLKTTELFFLSSNNSLRLIELDSLTNVNHWLYVANNAQLVSIEAPQLFETGESGQVNPSFYLSYNSILETVSIPSLRKVYDGIQIQSNNLLDTSTQFPCEMYVFFNDSFDCKPANVYVSSNLNNTYCFQDLSLRGATSLVTVPVSNITSTAAESGIQITLGSNSYVKQEQRGLVWSTSPNPILDDSERIDPFSSTNGNGNEDEVCYLYNLTPGTTYYYRVYAKDCNSTFYGNELSFTTPN